MALAKRDYKPSERLETTGDASLAGDLLKGTEGISVWWFGDGSQLNRKRIAKHIENRGLPVFRVGRTIYARKTVLLRWIAEQEAQSGKKSK